MSITPRVNEPQPAALVCAIFASSGELKLIPSFFAIESQVSLDCTT